MNQKTFEVISVNVSPDKGVAKKPVEFIVAVENTGVEGDAHAGPGLRQVSLLAGEDIAAMDGKGIGLKPGDFAENITTRGIDLASLPVGTRLNFAGVVLEVTQIGKECHQGCAIREQIGDCIMPKRGIFARVLEGGVISRESVGTYRI